MSKLEQLRRLSEVLEALNGAMTLALDDLSAENLERAQLASQKLALLARELKLEGLR